MALTVDDLLRDPPPIHGVAEDPTLYGLNTDALRYIERVVRPGDRTIETGSGYSTIVFTAAGADHTCVVPNGDQIRRISEYCERKGLRTSGLRFEQDRSERVLPRLEPEPLDVALLDGSHSFPQVFIDWFYVAERLRVGGVILIDDVHLWTGKVLDDFLRAEPGWTRLALLRGRTVVYRRDEGADPGRDWTKQPYVATRSRRAVLAKARIVGSMLRHGDLKEVARAAQRVARGR